MLPLFDLLVHQVFLEITQQAMIEEGEVFEEAAVRSIQVRTFNLTSSSRYSGFLQFKQIILSLFIITHF
jgi:hypothetical protein